MKNLFTTWLHTLEFAPYYFVNFEFKNITKSKIWRAIVEAENYIKASLRGFYNNLKVNTVSFHCVNNPQNENPDFFFDTDKLVVANPHTLVYKIEFTSPTAIKVSPDIGSIVTGSITGDIVIGDLTIQSAAWQSLTFKIGDVIYLGITNTEPLIVDLTSKLAAAKIIQNTFSSETSNSSNDAIRLENFVNSTIKRLIDPINPQLLSVSRISIDLDPIAIANEINEYGELDAYYSDDEIGASSL